MKETIVKATFKVDVNSLFNVTINDISVIYVTAHRCAGGPTVGLPRHRHFVGFFNVPVLAPTRDHPFYTVIPTHRPIQSPFTITLGIRRTHYRLNTPGPQGGLRSICRACKQVILYNEPAWTFSRYVAVITVPSTTEF